MKTRYYDSCVFGNALNCTHQSHLGCVNVTTVSLINWHLACCTELTAAELPSVNEFLSALIVACASNGISFLEVSLQEAKQAAKKNRASQKAFRQLGFDGHDWNHLMAAVHINAVEILTTDNDFIDPANKASGGAGRRVSDSIRENFGITVTKI